MRRCSQQSSSQRAPISQFLPVTSTPHPGHPFPLRQIASWLLQLSWPGLCAGLPLIMRRWRAVQLFASVDNLVLI